MNRKQRRAAARHSEANDLGVRFGPQKARTVVGDLQEVSFSIKDLDHVQPGTTHALVTPAGKRVDVISRSAEVREDGRVYCMMEITEISADAAGDA